MISAISRLADSMPATSSRVAVEVSLWARRALERLKSNGPPPCVMRFCAAPQNQNISASSRIQGRKPRIISCHQGRPDGVARMVTLCSSRRLSSDGSSMGGRMVWKPGVLVWGGLSELKSAAPLSVNKPVMASSFNVTSAT